MKIWIPATLIFAGLAGLVTMGILQGGIPELPVRTLMAQTDEYADREIKLQGVLKAIHKDTRPLVFDICDRENADLVVSVEVDDLRPDQFKVTNDIAVLGVYDSKAGKMHGTKIYTKCPSKYEASEEGGEYGETPAPESAEKTGAESSEVTQGES